MSEFIYPKTIARKIIDILSRKIEKFQFDPDFPLPDEQFKTPNVDTIYVSVIGCKSLLQRGKARREEITIGIVPYFIAGLASSGTLKEMAEMFIYDKIMPYLMDGEFDDWLFETVGGNYSQFGDIGFIQVGTMRIVPQFTLTIMREYEVNILQKAQPAVTEVHKELCDNEGNIVETATVT